jgi:hypothetical protein
VTAGLVTAALVLVVGAAILWFARKAGRDAERAKSLQTSYDAERNRAKIDDAVRRDPADDRGLSGYYRD